MSIAFEQVSFSYTPLTKRQKKAGEVQRYALRNVSFTLNDGEFLAIAGHTGSGKSTLVQHLNGLANPTEGRVLWNGKDLADRKTRTALAATSAWYSSTPNTSCLPKRSMRMWHSAPAIWACLKMRLMPASVKRSPTYILISIR